MSRAVDPIPETAAEAVEIQLSRPRPMPTADGRPETAGWQRVKVGKSDVNAAAEDEALRRNTRDVWLDVESLVEYDPDKRLDEFKALLDELLGRYEELYNIAARLAGFDLLDSNGNLKSNKPRENKPGTSHW